MTPPLRFLLDDELPHRLVSALGLLDLDRDIASRRDVYGSAARDAEWIPQAARDGYALVALQPGPTKRSLERTALRDHGLTVVYLGPFFAKRDYWGKVEWLVRYWPMIAAWLEGHPKGATGIAHENGSVRTATV